MTLRLVSVTQRFGSQVALDDVSLHVRGGELYGFLGHNGSGKTTAMRIALGLRRPTRGRVLVEGFDAARHPREARARLGGLIEIPGFHRGLDGRSNLVRLARLAGRDARGARHEAQRLLDLVGLASAGTKPAGAYSQGMRQRLGIAQALVGAPRIVLLDEPMNGLDPEGIDEVREVLRRLVRDEGVTVFLSSHQLREIADLCDRVAVIRRGRLLVEEETRTLLEGRRGRVRLRTADDEATARLLADRGLAHEPLPGGGRLVELGARSPAELARAVMERGVDLLELAPVVPTLEEVYLRFTRQEEAARSPSRPGAAPAASAPSVRLAPRFPVLRATRYEVARLASSRALGITLLAPAAVAVLAILRRRAAALGDASDVADEEVFSTTAVTAFEAVGVGLASGLPLLVAVLAAAASQALAGELGRGTLRNLVLRPVTRVQVVIAKGGTCLLLALAGYVLVAAASVSAGAAWFEFGDVAEILPSGDPFPLVDAEELWPELRAVLAAPVLPLFAYAALGFLAGSLVRSGTAALGIALGAVVVLDLGRVFAREWGIGGWMPSAHVPSPLGDESRVERYAQVVQGISNAGAGHGELAIVAPLCWSVAAFAASALVFRRRAIP